MRSMKPFMMTVKSYHYGRFWGFVRESLDVVPLGTCYRTLVEGVTWLEVFIWVSPIRAWVSPVGANSFLAFTPSAYGFQPGHQVQKKNVLESNWSNLNPRAFAPIL